MTKILFGVGLVSVLWLSGCLPTTMTVNINRAQPSATPSVPVVPPEVVSRGWSETLEVAFDIAETFDGLQPWRGRCGGTYYGSDSTPRRLDGSESMWTSYSCQADSVSGSSWIDDFGPGARITGNSLVIDMGATAKGPSRLGFYFGDGRANSGYDDLYLFYRVRFPRNMWPTLIDPTTQAGRYIAGEHLWVWSSWKFGAFNMGCTGINCSEMHIVPNIKRYDYGALAGKLALVAEPTGTNAYWATGREIQTERWLGVEFHYKLAQQDGQKVVVMETWIYDEDGTAHLAQAPVVHPYAALSAPAEKFNSFFLGGDNGGSYTWGPTMESAYHVDDFIINGTRIGPTYFQLANQVLSRPVDTLAPVITAFSMPAAPLSFVVPVTAFTASDNLGVTGYQLTLSATPPSADAAGWTAMPPSSFALPIWGTYTVYAWAKDAAGMISAPRSAVVVYSRPDNAAPVVHSVTFQSPSSSLTVPLTTIIATDDVGVTGYMISESPTPPLASAAGWSATVPASFTFRSEGFKTAYIWAKDASGKVSAVFTAGARISIPPVVTAFSMASTATSLTVPVIAFTATDNQQLAGYRITETPATPLSSQAWFQTAPTSYTFSPGGGVRTAYAWAMDWNGVISASRSATVTITLPPPVVTAFAMPATSTSLAVPVTSFTGGGAGGAGLFYLITETPTTPLPNSLGWRGAPITTYNFPAPGARVAYAWVKDVDGRISASRSATVTITLPVADTVAPLVTAFTMPATATSLTVPVTTFTGTDNIGVTGYRITESATAPLASATGWLATRPTSYTFSAAGARTAYAWVRDAAGAVSASRSAAVTITLPATGSWQATLERAFPIVETFNELQDWGANGQYPSGAGGTIPYDPQYLPKRADGSPSKWGYWNNKGPTPVVSPISGTFLPGETIRSASGAQFPFEKHWFIDGKNYLQLGTYPKIGSFVPGDVLTGVTSGATARMVEWPKIITNHGAANTWRGTGKSLLMNYGDNDNTGALKGLGAQRLGLFFGDGVTGKSGFKRIHVFMMVKFAPAFFGVSGTPSDIDYVRVFKFFDLCSGFTSIKRYGSDAEQPYIEQNPQTAVEYGANSSIVNLSGGGLSTPEMVYLQENIANATVTPNSNPVTYYEHVSRQLSMRNNDPAYPATGTELNKIYPSQAAGEWFGLEIMSDLGTLNTANGATELWIYDKNGAVKGHYSATGVLKLVRFDHYYNKITLGGNRRTGVASSKHDGRYWIDDFIVNGSRIGPTYFQLLGQ